MSDAGKTALWIVVAVAVIAVIIWLFVSAGRRRAAEARRFEASEQRGRVATRRADVRRAQGRRDAGQAAPAAEASPAAQAAPVGQATPAPVPAAAAPAPLPAAGAPAPLPAAGAPAQESRTADEELREHQEAERHRLAETAGAAGATALAPAAGAAAVGAAAFTQEDDEEDLADAENPFAATQATAVGTGSAETHAEERSTTVTQNPEPETADTADAAGTADAAQPATPPKATIDEPKRVEVPALTDRDEFVAEGGTPAGDPGDHRGQPWATTPGQHGPGDSEEPADEGLDVDMAPHSHASDDVDETAEAVDPGGDAPRREEAEPAPDAAAAAFPDEETSTTEEAAGEQSSSVEQSSTEQSSTADQPATDTGYDDDTAEQRSTRRTSSFDEVVDGGFGLGSAAPIADGAQPLGHAVKARRENRTFLAPGDAAYDDAEPDVWFYNEEAARRAGFNRQGE